MMLSLTRSHSSFMCRQGLRTCIRCTERTTTHKPEHAHVVTGAEPPEVPPGPAGEVGYGTAGEGVAAVDTADQEAAVNQDRKVKADQCQRHYSCTTPDMPVVLQC